MFSPLVLLVLLVLPWSRPHALHLADDAALVRRERIIAELVGWDSDLILLQEVEEEHWGRDLLPALKAAGYRGNFKKRLSDKADGCAMLWKADKLLLESYVAVDLDSGGRFNVGQVACMSVIGSDGGAQREVCVCNTHLLFNPNRGDIKLAQVSQLLGAVERMANKGDVKRPVLVGGDFNVLPFSPLYDLLTEGKMGGRAGRDPKVRDLSGQSKWKSAMRSGKSSLSVSLSAHGGRGGVTRGDEGRGGEGRGVGGAGREGGPILEMIARARDTVMTASLGSGAKLDAWWRMDGHRKVRGGVVAGGGAQEGGMVQRLRLASAYATQGDDGKVYEPLFTSCHEGGLASTVDYVLHSVDRGIRRVGVWEMLKPEVIMPGGVLWGGACAVEGGAGGCGIPNGDWGSDHLALCAMFELAGEEDGGGEVCV